MQLKLSPFKLRNWPLKTQGLVVIFAAQLALVIALLLVILNRSDAALQSSVERTQSEIDLLINTTLADPLLNRDLASLQNIVNEMVRGKLINAIKICSPTGVTLAHSGDISKLAVLPSFSQVKGSQWTETLAIKNTKYVEFSGKRIGKVEYVLSTAEQVQGARDLIFQFFLITGSCIFVTTTLVAISVARVVSRLRRLVAGTQALANGDSSATIPVNSKDEIGQLTEHFNAMAGAIDQRFAELRDAEREKAIYLSEVSNEQARLSALLESMRVGIVFLDTSGKQLYANSNASRFIGTDNLFLSVPAGQTYVDERDGQDGMIIYESCYPVFGKQSTEKSDSEQKRELIGSVWIFEDVTEERKSQQTIRFLAERDSLTGLLNRRSLTESLTNQLAAEPNTSFAAIYVDLDNFKIINDVHGHARGDDVLAKIAQRLTSMTRTSDLVARMGGDEFLIVVRDIDSADLANWCDRLLLQLSAGTLVAQDSAANVTCSIGVALAPRDADNAEALIAAADQAMYDAKRAGKNAWRPFLKHTERDAEKRQTLLWADRINNALRTDGFTVFLQGVHYAHNAEVHHWEALVRMPDPSAVGQFFSPGLFIGNAEKSGKIIDLDRWMIRRCAQILSENPHIEPIAVNMSALSLSDPSLPEFLKEVLHAYDIPGSRMHLELTETAALSDLQGARVAVSAIQSLGCHICLDDFGAGFASLSYLKHIEANYVKIDGMFIQNLQTDRENQVLLRAIIDIAHHSHRLTVAEWIENAETLQRVQAFGIDLVQGFHLSKPLPAEQVTAARRAYKQLSH